MIDAIALLPNVAFHIVVLIIENLLCFWQLVKAK